MKRFITKTRFLGLLISLLPLSVIAETVYLDCSNDKTDLKGVGFAINVEQQQVSVSGNTERYNPLVDVQISPSHIKGKFELEGLEDTFYTIYEIDRATLRYKSKIYVSGKFTDGSGQCSKVQRLLENAI